MKSYYHTLPNNQKYIYFYDINIQLWTIIKVDKDGNQIGLADYSVRKSEMLQEYDFKFIEEK